MEMSSPSAGSALNGVALVKDGAGLGVPWSDPLPEQAASVASSIAATAAERTGDLMFRNVSDFANETRNESALIKVDNIRLKSVDTHS
ncbi:hypothetical protein AERO9AM_70222 [Aeromicrobium sp. 9AM]|nr:hypothetical protein AERO9AM_70222 [Aeromicrobium sp. 9AM]